MAGPHQGSCEQRVSWGKMRVRVSAEVKLVGAWLVATRTVLWGVGLVSREILQPFLPVQEPGAPFTTNQALAVWGHWDTRWYLDIARRGYSAEPIPETGEANYAFFPLYPLLVRALAVFLGDVYLAGLIVSNASLLVAGILLYRLTAFEDDEVTARRAVKYLFLLPTAFVFSGVLSESLFVAVSVGAFYATRRNRWWLAGLLGGCAALSRPQGVLLILPLAWLCFADRDRRQRWLDYLPPLVLVPAGLAGWVAYTWSLTGDPLAFVNVQRAWRKVPSNPAEVLVQGLLAHAPQLRVGAWFGAVARALAFSFWRLLGFPYFLVCLAAVLPALSSGWTSLYSTPRYVASAWPLAILFAKLGRRGEVDGVAAASLALLQGFLMVFWSNGSRMVM